MSGEDTKLSGEKGKRGREQEGEQLPGLAMEDDWRREQIKRGEGRGEREMGERIGWGTTTTRPTMEDDEWR